MLRCSGSLYIYIVGTESYCWNVLFIVVATDIASKGLDFPEIEHVINYDMPEDIENYIHRIGRTGRGNHQGVATTFVNSKSCDKSILLDLKGKKIEKTMSNNLLQWS